jgi:hypothetical protein
MPHWAANGISGCTTASILLIRHASSFFSIFATAKHAYDDEGTSNTLPQEWGACGLGRTPYLEAYVRILFPSNSGSYFLKGKSLIYTLKLSWKFDFQPLTIKSDNRDHLNVKTEQI